LTHFPALGLSSNCFILFASLSLLWYSNSEKTINSSFQLSIRKASHICFCRAFLPGGRGRGYSTFQATGRCEWGHKLKPKKSLGLEAKLGKNPLNQNETSKKSHAKNLSLTNTPNALNGNKEEQQYFLNGRVCLFIYLSYYLQ